MRLGHEAFTSLPLIPLGTGALDSTGYGLIFERSQLQNGLITERSHLRAGAVLFAEAPP